MRVPKEWHLVMRSMGKCLRITAVFTKDDEANAFMKQHSEETVIAASRDLILMANKYDLGEEFADMLKEKNS